MWTFNFGESFFYFIRNGQVSILSLKTFPAQRNTKFNYRDEKNQVFVGQFGTFKKSVQKLHQNSDIFTKVIPIVMTNYFPENSRD